MRAILLSFFQILKFVRQDMMLFAAVPAPLLAGAAIHFAVPFLEKVLTSYTGLSAVLFPYYSLFDIFLASITPAMYCFIAAMVILEERDDHIDRYLFVSGLGLNGYFVSHIVLPALAAFALTAVLLPVFRLTSLSLWEIFFLSLSGTLQGIIIALLTVTLSSNKLEGIAVTKLAALTIFGAVLPYFVPTPFCFCMSFLPSFWVGMSIRGNVSGYMLLSVLIAGIWIMVLRIKYYTKLRFYRC